jgi:hypothetical protein
VKKLELLRNHLVNTIPNIKKNPDRLLTFIESGRIEFHRGQSLSHQYTVSARIVLTDYSGEIDAVMIPLLQWLSHYQPDLVPEEAVRFDAELLNNKAWDLALEVTLTERVVAVVNCDEGKIVSEHRTPEFPIDPCAAKNWQLYIRDTGTEDEYDLVAEWSEE